MDSILITMEIGDPDEQRCEPVDTEARFARVPREILERQDMPVESVYTTENPDGSRIERPQGRTMIQLEGREFSIPVTFGEDGRASLLVAIALEYALLAVDLCTGRLAPVEVLEMAGPENQRREALHERTGSESGHPQGAAPHFRVRPGAAPGA